MRSGVLNTLPLQLKLTRNSWICRAQRRNFNFSRLLWLFVWKWEIKKNILKKNRWSVDLFERADHVFDLRKVLFAGDSYHSICLLLKYAAELLISRYWIDFLRCEELWARRVKVNGLLFGFRHISGRREKERTVVVGYSQRKWNFCCCISSLSGKTFPAVLVIETSWKWKMNRRRTIKM